MRTDDEQTQAKLEALTKHLAEVKRFEPTSNPNAKPRGDAARAAIDFASATTVGTLLGFGLDAWQNTSPWGLLGGLFLGTAAGVKQMLAAEKRRALTEQKKTNATKQDT